MTDSPDWQLVETVKVPVGVRPREPSDHPLSPPEVTVWETHYRWRAAMLAVTKTPDPPIAALAGGQAAVARVHHDSYTKILWLPPAPYTYPPDGTPLYTRPAPVPDALLAGIEREADAHDYFASNGDLRMTTGDHAARAKKLRELIAATKEAGNGRDG